MSITILQESYEMSDKTQNKENALEFLDFIFKDMGEYSDGKIEVGTKRYANTFDLDEKVQAVEFAFQQNYSDSLYMSPALLIPDSPKVGRGHSDLFYATSVLWCDIDTWIKTPEDKERLKFLYDHCKPNRIVQTSSAPHMKFQLWWKLDECCDDTDKIEEALLGVQQHLEGDPKVVRHYGLMRLAGSYSNPSPDKLANGSIVEPVKYFNLHDEKVNIDKFIQHYPVTDFTPMSDKGSIGAHFEKVLTGGMFDTVEKVIEGRDVYASNMIFSAIANLTGELERWPTLQEVIDDVWPVYSRKVAERDGISLDKANRGEKLIKGKIISKLKAFQNGRMARLGMADVDDIVFSHKAKQDKKEEIKNQEQANIKEEIKQKLDDSFDILNWSTKTNYRGKAKDIEWLIDGVLPVGVPLMLAAVGGIGKSYKMLEIALRLSEAVLNGGNKKVLGGDIVSHGNVAIFSAEDSYESIHRRLNAIDPNETRQTSKHEAFIVPMSEIGGAKPLIKTTSNGTQVDEFYDVIKAKLLQIPDLKLVVFDPLQAFVDGDISSSNEFAQALYSRCLVPLATELKATILVIHHMRKDGSSSIKTAADARNAIRGVSALVDSGRGTYCLWNVVPEIAASLQAVLGNQYDENRFVHGAMVKFNDQHNSDITTYYRDENGLLVDIGTVDISGEVSGLTTDQCKQALREIRCLWEDGVPLRLARNSDKNIHKWLIKNFKITDKQAKIQVDNWTVMGFDKVTILEEREFIDARRHTKKGIYVVGLGK